MASLEERREARRRRRQQQDDEAASEISTVNGEDDLDRRRRERREARLRQAAEQEEDTSSRRSRRRQQEEETPAEETSSYRSRRRRGQEEEETPAAEEPAEDTSSSQPAEEDNSAAEEAAAEAARRRREEQEEEARQAAEAESRRQEQEEARKREEEERRKQQEAEDKKRKCSRNEGSMSSTGSFAQSPGDAANSDNYSFSFDEGEESVEEVLEDVLSDAEDVFVRDQLQGCYGVVKVAEARELDGKEKLEHFEGKNDKCLVMDGFEDNVDHFEGKNDQFQIMDGYDQMENLEEKVASFEEKDEHIEDKVDCFEERIDNIEENIDIIDGFGDKIEFEDTAETFEDSLDRFEDVVEETVQDDFDDGGGGYHKWKTTQHLDNEVIAINQPAMLRPASVMSGTYNLEDSGTHHIQVPTSPQLKDEIRDDISVVESIDAASVIRHLDWTTDDQLDDNSSNDEMQGLMEEYEKLVNDESEFNMDKNLGEEIAEAVADDDILGRDVCFEDSLEDNDEVYLISCTKKGDIPEPLYHPEDCGYGYGYEIEAGGSDSSSGKEYCLSVFDSSVEYDRPVCSETFNIEQGSDDLKPVPRLTLPSDLNESCTQASSDRKELLDAQVGNMSADSSLFLEQSTRSEISERTLDADPVQDFVSCAVKRFLCDAASLDSEKTDTATPRPSFSLQQTYEFVAESTMQPEKDLHSEEFIQSTETQIVIEQKQEQIFDEDILPRVADEELENEELGDDVLFFIPGTMEPIPESEDTYLTEDDQLNGYESCSSESEDMDPPQTMIFRDTSPEEQKTSSSSDEQKDSSDVNTFVQPVFTRHVNDIKRYATPTQERRKVLTPNVFSSVLTEIVQRGSKMNESLTYGLKVTEKEVDHEGRIDQEKTVPNRNQTSSNFRYIAKDDFKSPPSPQMSEVSEPMKSSTSIINNNVSHSRKSSNNFKSSPRQGMSGSSEIEDQLSKDNIPPVLRSWKAKCASASSEDEDNSTQRNPANNKAFSQVLTQLKQGDVNSSKRKSYSRTQEMLCVTSLTEQVAEVKVMGRAGRPKVDVPKAIQHDAREFFSSDVTSELHHLGAMKPVTGEYVNTEFKPQHPRIMLQAFLQSLAKNEASQDVRNNVINTSEVRKYIESEEKEEVKSFADKVTMFQTVASKTQANPSTTCSSLKQSLSNLLTDLKERSSPWDSQQTTPRSYIESRSRSGSVVTTPRSFMGSCSISESLATTPRSYSRSRSASLVSTPRFSESQHSTPRTAHESNFLNHRRHSIREGIEDDQISSHASQIEMKLSNLLNSMTNISSKSSRSLDRTPLAKTNSEAPVSPRESPRTFFDNFMRRRSSTTLKDNISTSMSKQESNVKHVQHQPASSLDSPDSSKVRPYTRTEIAQKKSGKTSPPPVAPKTYKKKLNNQCHVDTHTVLTKDVITAEVDRAVSQRSSQKPSQSSFREPSQSAFKEQPQATGRAITHEPIYEHGHQHISYNKERCEKEILPSNDLCALQPKPSKDPIFHNSRFKNNNNHQPTTTYDKNIASASYNSDDANSVCQVPKITSYLKVKSFQMLAESFDEEISHLSISDDNADLHLNLSGLSDGGYAHSTPRLPFFKHSSNFFCPTPRSDRDESINSPRVVNKAAKGWGAEGPTEIPIEIKTPPPCNEVLLSEEQRMEEERLERERQEKEEASRRKEEEEKKKKGKRKGLGGLSPEKKKLLKRLIMQKAAEDLRNEAMKKAQEKEQYINERVPVLKTEGMNQADLSGLCKDLHAKVCALEEDVYDWEIKIRKQEFEINELTLKVNDTKGKFIKPVLRKVNKTESKLAKLDKKESRDFRSNLKSTGQNKFALDEKEEVKTPDWRQGLKGKGEGEAAEGEEAPAES